MSHERCARARRDAALVGSGPRWVCAACGTTLATTHPVTGTLAVAQGLVPLGSRHGLPAYGPRWAVRSRGARGIPRRGHPFSAWTGAGDFVGVGDRPPLFAYCPLAGCGKGQHLD